MALQKTIRLFEDKESGVSTHFVIPRNEEEGIIQFVDVRFKAWHAGRALMWKKPDVNLYSIGVQLVGVPDCEYTEWQYEAAAAICAELMNQESAILLNRIISHDAIAERAHGPGPFWNWQLFFNGLIKKMYGMNKTKEDDNEKEN